ncbi:hypothetical protein CPB84DRAFT_1324325 [Gymnopilus junonius]|uniref:Uncharacterized protein n=1 Tax=Gymnopilus junonius TaxID=109634 RepID=A0A9P5TLH8_GYMJU|nr:hypothetical protein CPB84DRAFT_1324325 [Gymnopilus junonius]
MSSTSISITPSSSSPPQSTSSSGSNAGSRKNGFNNLLFFVIFFVLLIAFVAVGTITRRRRRSRGFEFDLTMDDDELTPEEVEQARPVLYELGSREAVETGWKYEKPLSATLIKTTQWTSIKGSIEDDTVSVTRDGEDPAHLQDPAANDRLGTLPSFSPSSWRRGRSSSSQPKRSSSFFDEEIRPIESPEALEVAVMIAMPSRERSISAALQQNGPRDGDATTHSHSEPSSLGLPEYQIGTMTVPWHTELKRESIAIDSGS